MEHRTKIPNRYVLIFIYRDKFETAVLGDLKLSVTSPYHMELDIEGLVHPEYNSETIENDIAIIRFQTQVEFVNDYIIPICLGENVDSNQYQTCYVTGWGYTVEGMEMSI